MAEEQRRRVSDEEVAGLKKQFDFYQRLVSLEMAGLGAHEVYELSFSRLLKPDAMRSLGYPDRPLMLGTDQRDCFIPVLARAFERLPEAPAVLDVGAGDGQTVGLLLERMPQGAVFHLEEPNEHYLEAYRAMLAQRRPDIACASASALGIDGYLEEIERVGGPAEGSLDLCLALHMLYFTGSVPWTLSRLIDRLKPGGRLFVVMSDPAPSFSARVDRHCAAKVSEEALAAMAANLDLWEDLLGRPGEDASVAMRKALDRNDIAVALERQPTRLYGQDLGDLIAMVLTTGLSVQDGRSVQSNIDSARTILEDEPDFCELSVELAGPRRGMWSVLQQQFVFEVTRL